MVTRSSYELAAESDQRTSYHFYPCAFSKVIAWFHQRVDRRNLLENGDLFGWKIDANNPLPGMQRSLAYLRGVLAGLETPSGRD